VWSAVVYFDVCPWHLFGGTEDHQKKAVEIVPSTRRFTPGKFRHEWAEQLFRHEGCFCFYTNILPWGTWNTYVYGSR